MARISKMEHGTKMVICDMFKQYVNMSRLSNKAIASAMGVHANNVGWCMTDPIKVSSGACEIMEQIMTYDMTLDEWVGKHGLKTSSDASGTISEKISPTDVGMGQEIVSAVTGRKKALKLEIELIIKLNGKEIAKWNG